MLTLISQYGAHQKVKNMIQTLGDTFIESVSQRVNQLITITNKSLQKIQFHNCVLYDSHTVILSFNLLHRFTNQWENCVNPTQMYGILPMADSCFLEMNIHILYQAMFSMNSERHNLHTGSKSKFCFGIQSCLTSVYDFGTELTFFDEEAGPQFHL